MKTPQIKIAIQSARHAGMVTLPNNDRITSSAARRAGYAVARDTAHAAELQVAYDAAVKASETTFCDLLLALPEAAERPLAAARIATSHTISTMPLKKAALFLSGLPIETEVAQSSSAKPSPAADNLLKRKCEIHLIGLRRKAVIGDREAKSQANAISYALNLHAGSTMPFVDALAAMKVDFPQLSKALHLISDPT